MHRSLRECDLVWLYLRLLPSSSSTDVVVVAVRPKQVRSCMLELDAAKDGLEPPAFLDACCSAPRDLLRQTVPPSSRGREPKYREKPTSSTWPPRSRRRRPPQGSRRRRRRRSRRRCRRRAPSTRGGGPPEGLCSRQCKSRCSSRRSSR
jgi:hypothetical protein